MSIVLDEQYYRKLEELQAVGFALVELTLYLDTHPHDAQAIQQFNQLGMQLHQCRQQFESLYGPTLQYGNSFSKYPWQWSESPWPWQV
ncbi:spore coat protein CotJB [Paenibacillus lupini]|uniref:spore coat protein CotJB n=1 Tax=Paenibacillus lupini TaxID=1450204 RepID=UPI001FBA0F02|nr:spore coat protein CotJB [Paenibacillus lupini]NIK24930.1 spore coat protein JB [Paenibacillus lupini]